MAITQENLKKLAKLSQLHLDDTTLHERTQSLDEVLGYVEILQRVDTSRLPSSSPFCLPLVDDTVRNHGEKALDLLASSPHRIIGRQIAVGAIFAES